MNYYYYISGLPDLQPDNYKAAPALADLAEELDAVLSKKDKSLLDIFRRRYDNDNLLRLLKDKDAEVSPLGTLTRDEWLQLIELMDNSDELHRPKDKRLLPYVLKFYVDSQTENQEKETGFSEDYLSSLYYDYAMKSSNEFVSRWFEFNLNVNNVLTALACRKYGWDIKSAVVGENNIARIIRNSTSSRDFNLKNEVEYFDTLVSISDTQDLLERERRIDALKWNWLEDNTFFNYFSVEKILVFWLRCELLHRWDNLTMEEGAEIFRSMINDLKKDVKF